MAKASLASQTIEVNMKKQKTIKRASKKMKREIFRVELEHKISSSSFVDVQAADSGDAFAKVMNMLSGHKVVGISAKTVDITDMKQEKHYRPIKSLDEVEFDYPKYADPSRIKIGHIHKR